MKLLEKILLAIDFCESSENIVENAITLAKTFESKITLIHVLPDDIKSEKARLLLNETAIERLGAIRNKIKNEGLETENPVLEFGIPFDKIIQTSDSINANLILIGSGEKSKNDVFRLGITAEKIIRKSDKPVWVVKKDSPFKIRNILCPVDFSPESKRALKNTINIAQKFNAEIIILSVCEIYFTNLLRGKYDLDEENEIARLIHKRNFMSFLKDFNLTNINWGKEIEYGDPAIEILDVISKHKFDLLIMGATGKTRVNRLIMGSVTEKVIREIPCSFITLKTEDIIGS